MSSFKWQPFSKKQRMVFTWWLDNSPVKDANGLIADGAIRSGKTLNMADSFVMWAMSNFDGMNFAMCGKTILSFRRNVLSVMKDTLPGMGYKIKDRRADNMLTITSGKVTNDFYLFGGKDEASQDLIQGLTLAGVFFDEVALMPESFVNQATARCSVDGSKWFFNCNPGAPTHWFKKNWLDRADDKRLLYLHFTMDDNPSLSDEIKERYRSQYTGIFYKRYIDGLWVAADGLIYDGFSEERHVTTELPEMANVHYVSVDYGTQNATDFLHWQLGKDNKWYIVKEYCYSGRDEKVQKTDAEYVEDMLEFTQGYSPRAVIVDPSAASFIAALREKGLPVIKAKNDVLDGIRYTATCFSQERFKIHSSCENLITELHGYVWDDKAAEMGVEKPMKVQDHGCDAMRYFIYTILAQSSVRISDKHERGFN